jgi:hypothetical protein
MKKTRKQILTNRRPESGFVEVQPENLENAFNRLEALTMAARKTGFYGTPARFERNGNHFRVHMLEPFPDNTPATVTIEVNDEGSNSKKARLRRQRKPLYRAAPFARLRNKTLEGGKG